MVFMIILRCLVLLAETAQFWCVLCSIQKSREPNSAAWTEVAAAPASTDSATRVERMVFMIILQRFGLLLRAEPHRPDET
jgi:hypothetical protein